MIFIFLFLRVRVFGGYDSGFTLALASSVFLFDSFIYPPKISIIKVYLFIF